MDYWIWLLDWGREKTQERETGRQRGRSPTPRTDISAQESRGKGSSGVGVVLIYKGGTEGRETGVKRLTETRLWRTLYALSLDLLRSHK